MVLKCFMMQLDHLLKKHLIANVYQDTHAKIIEIVNDITTSTVNDRPITEEEINIILRYMDDEIGNLHLLCETFENKEVLSLMSELRKLIAQANTGKK